jgi:hypothetical protein
MDVVRPPYIDSVKKMFFYVMLVLWAYSNAEVENGMFNKERELVAGR